jgi:hypothetical protein
MVNPRTDVWGQTALLQRAKEELYQFFYEEIGRLGENQDDFPVESFCRISGISLQDY